MGKFELNLLGSAATAGRSIDKISRFLEWFNIS